jgi:hypothetical protein
MTTIQQWKTGINYILDVVVCYDNKYYVCINAHKSQTDWFPSVGTASLWKPVVTVPVVTVPVVTVPVVTVPVVTVPVVTPVNQVSGTIIAPYLYTWGIGNSSYKINSCIDVYNKIKGNAVTLAFVIAGSGNQIAQDIYAFTNDIKAFIAVGGLPIISFGGAAGTYVEQQLSITDIVLQISTLIDTTGCRHLDFDIEGGNLSNRTLNDKRSKSIAQLQAKYFGLYISFTLPADTNGLTVDGIACIQNAIDNGVHVSCVNIMAMDLGSLPINQSWGTTACAMGETTITQLKSLFPAKSTVELYKLLGICPMIGKNDDGTIFTPDDAKMVSNYAKKNNIGLISFWAINRDQIGTGDLGVYSQCNKVDFEYYTNFKSASGTSIIVPPVVTPIIVPIPSVPVVVISPKWTNNTIYTVGDKVSQGTSNYVYVNSHISTLLLEPTVTPAIWKKL